MSQHMSTEIRKLTTKVLLERIESFRHSRDTEMLGWLINEAKRRGL